MKKKKKKKKKRGMKKRFEKTKKSRTEEMKTNFNQIYLYQKKTPAVQTEDEEIENILCCFLHCSASVLCTAKSLV
jgi:hypothetical protein